jgi:hypothetical protein
LAGAAGIVVLVVATVVVGATVVDVAIEVDVDVFFAARFADELQPAATTKTVPTAAARINCPPMSSSPLVCCLSVLPF